MTTWSLAWRSPKKPNSVCFYSEIKMWNQELLLIYIPSSKPWILEFNIQTLLYWGKWFMTKEFRFFFILSHDFNWSEKTFSIWQAFLMFCNFFFIIEIYRSTSSILKIDISIWIYWFLLKDLSMLRNTIWTGVGITWHIFLGQRLPNSFIYVTLWQPLLWNITIIQSKHVRFQILDYFRFFYFLRQLRISSS